MNQELASLIGAGIGLFIDAAIVYAGLKMLRGKKTQVVYGSLYEIQICDQKIQCQKDLYQINLR